MSSVSELLRFGQLMQCSGDVDKAAVVFSKIVDKHPEDFRAYYNRATCLLQLQRPQDALVSLEGAEGLKGCNVYVYGALSKVLISLKRPEDAVRRCRQGLALDATDAVCLANVNVALRMLDRMDEAILLSWEAMGLPPFNPTTDIPSPSSSSSSCSESATVTVVVVKWGTKYGPEYVNRLQGMVAEHGFPSRPFRLVCFTEDSSGLDAAVHVLPLPTGGQTGGEWKGWWNKAHLFSAAAAEAAAGHDDHILYLDLDTVVCGPLDFLLEPPPLSSSSSSSLCPRARALFSTLGAAAFPTEGRSCGVNSSVMYWRNGTLTALHTFLETHYAAVTKVLFKFDHWLEMMLGPVTHCIEQEQAHARKIVDYGAYAQHESAGAEAWLCGVSVVCFPLRPKPHELAGDSPMYVRWVGAPTHQEEVD